MPDEPGKDGPATKDEPETEGTGRLMIYVALILMAILLVLIVFMNFSGQAATASTKIMENTWSLQSYTGADSNTTPVLNRTVITAEFSTSGKLTGTGGCNSYSGRYMIQSTMMVVSHLTTTSIACQNNNATLQEKQYYALLEDAAALRIHNGVLTLYGIDGKPTLIFTRAPPGY